MKSIKMKLKVTTKKVKCLQVTLIVKNPVTPRKCVPIPVHLSKIYKSNSNKFLGPDCAYENSTEGQMYHC